MDDVSLRESAERLPAAPGIYRFLAAESELPIYIGKSINIRQRVLSHLSAARRDKREQKLVTLSNRITHRVTPGELSALLLESEEVKRYQPLLNRRLRRQKKLLMFQLTAGKTDFLYPRLVPASWPPPAVPEVFFGLYASAKQAQTKLRELARQQALCLAVLGLERAGSACFARQLKRCRGACVGAESVQQHNERLLEAIESYRIKAWPFSGAVAIRETPEADYYNIINQWHYLGVSNTLTNARQKVQCATDDTVLLDRDAYRIVSRWLLAPPAGAEIIAL